MRFRIPARAVFAALLLLAAAGPLHAQGAAVETGFLNAVARMGDQSMPYVVYVPRDYVAEKQWPVILFLHGAGERGDNGLAQTGTGIGTAIRRNPERFPCLVVMPQCPNGRGWGARIGNLVDESPETAQLALAALDATMKRYRCDPDRVYLTGLSLGGFGSWYIAAKNPQRFAAVIPVCGGGDPAQMAGPLKDLPIWAFHGDQDQAVLPARSREMVEAIKAAGGTKVKYTEYPGVGHNSWDRAYGDAEVIAWLLAQRRGQ